MNDRGLLELAAKALGGEFDHGADCITMDGIEYEQWNPLTDDGDALRLANRIHCRIETPKYKGFGATCGNQTVFRDDPDEQLRRAIVMYAAELGKARP